MTRHTLPTLLRTALPIAAALALAACKAPASVAPPGATGTATQPAVGVGKASPPATVTGASGHGAIQLIDPQAGSRSFVTAPGPRLTVVASSAGNPTTTAPMRFSVSPVTSGAAAYRADADMPWRSGFVASHAGIDPAAKPAKRRLLAAPERELGSTERFWINTGDSRAASDVDRPCVLKRKTANALFYVDLDAKPITDVQLDKLTAEWEERIYPRLTGAFGQEARPGVDGENRVFIVLSPAVDNWGKEKGLMGYFWSRDAIPAQVASNSNQKEVLFMTDQLFDRPPLTSFGTLAHEFQHMLCFSQKAARLGYRLAEETWLDEGLSMYAMDVAGYGLPQGDYHIAKDLRAFQEAPQDYTLTEWGANPPGFAYGQSYLFVRYLVDRYGPETVREILASDRAGVPAVEEVLARRNTTFAKHFRDWAITNVVSGTPLAEGTPYRYKEVPLTGVYHSSTGLEDIVLRGFQSIPAASADLSVALKPWGTAYYSFAADAPRAWGFTLGSGTSDRLLGAAIVP